VLKNKHQAVSQGVRRFGKRSIFIICEHLQKPHNEGSRPEAQFFSTRSHHKEATMGLFDFVKEIGHKLFNRDEEAAEKIKKHIEDPNPGIEGLSVEYKNGTVFLSGKAASPEAMEKAVLMAGNVKGVSEVNIDGLQAPPVQAKVEYYIIKKGDTLSAIAKQFYGKANDYPRIFEANREVIKDANLIFPGQKIRIPLA
jgi:hypothetical protein